MYSFWLDKEKKYKKEFDYLKKDENVDVCIIGGGLTGVSTAYYLSKKSNLKIAILEKDFICDKTSGHSTAKITSQHDLFYKYLINSKGKEYAKKYLESNENAIEEIEKIIKEENINCDFERVDSYVYTENEKELEKIKDEVESVNLLKENICEFVENISIPRKIKGAVKFKNQAQFNPVKYVYGLCDVLIKNKVNIYENTKVIDVRKEGNDYIIITDKKEVKAKYVVFACRYPIINTPGFYFLKMYQSISYVICIDPKVDLNFDGMYLSVEHPKLSIRTIKDGNKKILLIAGYDHKTGEDVIEEERYSELEKQARKMYPDCEIIGRWHAEDCIGLDKIPYIGVYSNLIKDFFIGTGYKKWGITTSNIAGNIISDNILEKENEYEDIYKATRFGPIKNSEEFGNIIKQSVKSLIIDKLKIPKETIDDLKIDEGKLVEVEGEKVRNI